MAVNTTLTLVRHGETTWNVARRWQGQTDTPLSPAGRVQAQLLAARLSAEPRHFDHLYASDLQRAWETAMIISPAVGLVPLPLPDLREVHVGNWSGLTTPEIIARYGSGSLAIVEQGGKRGEHGESDTEFADRITSAIRELARRHAGEHLLVVSHGAVIRTAVYHLVAPLDLPAYEFRNTSLTTIVWDGTIWRLELLNDHAHLPVTQRSASEIPGAV